MRRNIEVICHGCQQDMLPMRRQRRTWDTWEIVFYCPYCGREERRDEAELARDIAEPGTTATDQGISTASSR